MTYGISVALLTGLAIGLVALFAFLHQAKGNGWDLADAFKDPLTGKASVVRIMMAIGCLTGVWLIVAMELAHRTNEFIVGGFFAYCAGVYAIAKMKEPPAPPADGSK